MDSTIAKSTAEDFGSEHNKIEDVFLNAIHASELHGQGLRKVTSEIQKISAQMATLAVEDASQEQINPQSIIEGFGNDPTSEELNPDEDENIPKNLTAENPPENNEEPTPIDESVPNETTSTESNNEIAQTDPKTIPETEPISEQSPTETTPNQTSAETNPENKTLPETSSPAQPDDTPSEATEATKPDQSNPFEKILDKNEGEPFVPTDEAGHPLPRDQEQKQENSPDSADPNPATNPESTASPTPDPKQRGILTQSINAIRNRKLIQDIDLNKITILSNDKKKLEKELKKIKDKLKPMEREKKLLQLAMWGFIIIKIFLMILAAILACTIIFFIIPVAQAVWFASNIPEAAADGLEFKINRLEKEMGKNKNEEKNKIKEIKTRTEEIKKWSRERMKLINQSLLQSNK